MIDEYLRHAGRHWISILVVGCLVSVSIGCLVVLGPRLAAHSHAVATPTPVTTDVLYANQAHVHPVSADFQEYYAAHQGTAWFGAAISPEVADDQTIVQYYQNGVLRRRRDPGSTVAPDEIVATLIVQGAVTPLGGMGSSLTYASLEAAALPHAQITPPPGWQAQGDPAQVGIFVPAGVVHKQTVGYFISPDFATALLKLDVWQDLVGLPLTNAVAGTLRQPNGLPHHIVVQAFSRAVLWVDHEQPGTPQLQPVGYDYLALLGLPPITVAAHTPVWTVGNQIAVWDAAAGKTQVAMLLTPNALALTGASQWVENDLWYAVIWQNLAATRTGWLNADLLRLTLPAHLGMQLADLATLAPQLAHDAARYGTNVGLTIYLPASQRYFVANPHLTFEMASTFKIPILATLLHQAEQAHRALTSTERDWATAMIEWSDNIAEGEMYDEVGQWYPIQQYMAALGYADLRVNTDGIGSSLMSPLAMARLIDDLRTNRILTPADCAFVLDLMRHVVPYQRMGLGETAPAGASVALKDGYDVAIDQQWVMNTVGTVTVGGQSYVVALYTRDHASIDAGHDVVNQLCADITHGLQG